MFRGSPLERFLLLVIVGVLLLAVLFLPMLSVLTWLSDIPGCNAMIMQSWKVTATCLVVLVVVSEGAKLLGYRIAREVE